MENRSGPIVDACLTKATGTAEPEAALAMPGDLPDGRRVTVAPIRLTTRRLSWRRRGR
jgi:hypothetical protein